MRPNREAFRAFLKSGSSQKTGVMGVTGVMEIARHFPTPSEMDERQAMAEMEGGVPPLYSAGFARLQLTPPPGLSIPRWLQAVDDAGCFLDAFGQQAQSMGWQADDLFRVDGLVRALEGAHVTKLTATSAYLSDGRSVLRRKLRVLKRF
ncbi:hypothetical protein ACFOYU_00180 [Microvirga sp. GCM10011540]|uniref:hypothetical protein n=1 Tax=Microvirga sp. GCM10011540 TaxID=3317338 RepID=UPI003619B5A8